jgi:hypothetical protein
MEGQCLEPWSDMLITRKKSVQLASDMNTALRLREQATTIQEYVLSHQEVERIASEQMITWNKLNGLHSLILAAYEC